MPKNVVLGVLDVPEVGYFADVAAVIVTWGKPVNIPPSLCGKLRLKCANDIVYTNDSKGVYPHVRPRPHPQSIQ